MNRILLTSARRDLRASLAQTVALVVIVALGVTSLSTLVGAYRDLGSSYNHTYDELDFADVTFSLEDTPSGVVDKVGSTDGVEAVTGRLVVDTGLELSEAAQQESGQQQIRARLIGIPPDRHPEVNDVLVLEGGYLDRSRPRSVLIESHFADYYHSQPGDSLTILSEGRPVVLDVAGVAASPEYLIVSSGKDEIVPSARTFAVMFVSLPELQHLAGAGDSINDIAVRFSPGADGDTVVSLLQEELKPYGLKETTLRKDQPSYAALKLDLDGYREIAYMMPGLILLVAAASLYVMLSRQVRAHQSQIGLMKALGYESRTVAVRYLAQAAIIGVIGSIFGLLASLPLTRWITEAYAGELGIPLVQTHFYVDLMLAGVVLSLIMVVLGGLGPALSSARMRPATAMRQDPAAALTSGRLSLLERLIRLPFWLRLPLRNLFRARRRTLSTGLGVIFSFTLVLMSWGVIDAMGYMVSNNFQSVELWDAAVYFSQPQSPGRIVEIRQIEGITEAVPLFQIPAVAEENGESHDLFLTGLPPGQNLHHLQLNQDIATSDALSGDGIVMNTQAANKLGLKVGDPVTVQTYMGDLDLVLSGTVDELMSAAAYVPLDAIGRQGGAPGSFNGAFIAAGSADRNSVSTGLYRLPDAASVQLKSEIEKDWQSLTGLFYTFMGVIMAFAVTMAFALLFNTMTVNVLERRREIATMRSVGTGRARIALLVSTESFMLWLVTLIPGLVMGWLAARQMGAAFQSDLFTFKIVMSPASLIVTALGILATMLLAAIPAIRRINRLNLAEATKILN